MKTLIIPELAVVAIIGVSSSGKSHFAKKHFLPTEVLSSDFCRALVSDNENEQSASKDAFDILYSIAAKRLAGGKLTVIDATNLQKEARKPILQLAHTYHAIPVAIVLDLPEKILKQRNKERCDRNLRPRVLHEQREQLYHSIRHLKDEGFRYVYVLKSVEELDEVVIQKQKLFSNLKHEKGPFDIIGDVHGCFDELCQLLSKLGYFIKYRAEENRYEVQAPQDRKIIFLGDLVDRGPKIPQVIQLVMDMAESGIALSVPGNHDIKLMRKLRGKNVKIAHGIQASLDQLQGADPAFIDRIIAYIDGLVSHYVLDDGKLVVAHAGLKEEFHGRGSSAVRAFATFGDVTGELDEEGLPERLPWYNDYRGKALVVYGHTAVLEPAWINHTINIDTGCVFGGKLSCLRYPEKEIVSVPAITTYEKPTRPLQNLLGGEGSEIRNANLLDIQDVLGKKVIQCRHYHKVTLREEEAPAALELMSRFAIDPKWLIYLPPTMSPAKTSACEEFLEYPTEAFEYFREVGVSKVICQEKHMGSRAIAIVCKNQEAAQNRFGEAHERSGVCYTRTGRPFFTDPALENAFIKRLEQNLNEARVWEQLSSDWVCLDCEIMPWSAKAGQLLLEQYAPVGAASQIAFSHAATAMKRANLHSLADLYLLREACAKSYVEAYRRYSWQVVGLEDLQVAPFHILASHGAVLCKKDHLWHMKSIQSLCDVDPKWLKMTSYQVVDVNDAEQCQKACEWWLDLTAKGGEGMVVKPLDFTVSKKNQELIQPGIKIRGKEYLRIIYGLEYSLPENLVRLKERHLGKKRSLALREFALGLEALERFIENEPLWRVHECVFAILALESEAVDPRL